MVQRRRRKWMALAAVPALLVVVFFAFSPVAEWVVRNRAIPKVSRKLGRTVTVGDIDVGLGQAHLRDVVVRGDLDGETPLVEVPSVAVEFGFWASLFGKVTVDRIILDGARVVVTRDIEGNDNVRDLLESVGGKTGGGTEESGRSPSSSNVTIEVRDASSLVRIEGGPSLNVTGIETEYRPNQSIVIAVAAVEVASRYGPVAALEDLIVTMEPSAPLETMNVDVGNGYVEVWKPGSCAGDEPCGGGMRLSGIHGSVQRSHEVGRLLVDLVGSYGGANEDLWWAAGWIDPRSRSGKFTLEAKQFSLKQIPELPSLLIEHENTTVNAKVDVDIARDRAQVSGHFAVAGLNVFHEGLAQEPLRDMHLDARLLATYDFGRRVLEVPQAVLRSRGVEYRLRGTAALPLGLEEGGRRRDHPRVDFAIDVPPVGCPEFLASIPGAFVPKLDGFHLDGVFHANFGVKIDWADLEMSDLTGSVGIAGCKVRRAPPAFDAERLMSTFSHETLVGPEEYESVTIGMESDHYVPIYAISSYFLNAILTTEDSAFYQHKGFITREFRTAMVKNLQAGRFRYGASSITMQMVKNVFLYRDKTLSRKVQELFLTWYVETVLEKDRILEIYVNAIEYGPALYGILPASRTYFDKLPRELTPLESVFLASLLPAPRRRYFQYCQGKVSAWTAGKMERVLRRMHQRGRLSDDELADALSDTLEFNSEKKRDICAKRPEW